MADASDVSLDLGFQTHDSTANNVKYMHISTAPTQTSTWENKQKEHSITDNKRNTEIIDINLNTPINPFIAKLPASLPGKTVSLTADLKRF